MYKKCVRCGEEKTVAEFRKDARREDGLHSWCKTCARAFGKSAYIQRYAARVRKQTRDRCRASAIKIQEYKLAHPCGCGETEVACLEFHHKNPKKKDFVVSSGMNRQWKKVLVEMEKCIVVCANCHRKIHKELEGWWSGLTRLS